ncbi:LytTR family DNA-binding domain-containing protein [Phaeodactylibacter xiamenensis]|uniref:LytTR family DNA-binding domain-containing protein n=1 Tax=Phaeodactylibacter xiamenensis TaxID=1524460 RepID=UPI003BAB7772
MTAIVPTIRQFLQKPFPETESWPKYFRNIALISLFVALFLYIFQPFGISTIESGKALTCLGFGLMTFAGALVFQLIYGFLSSLRHERQFTFGHWIVYMSGIMLTISLCNFLYARLLFFGDIRWEFFPSMIYGTFMVGFFPMVALGLLSLIRQEHKYLAIAKEINQEHPHPAPPGPQATEALFGIPTHNIRYIEALQNYVRIGYLDEANELREQTERATLKSILDQIDDKAIVRCHRSYLVNRTAVADAAGNAQGLMLTLADCPKTVPVSRSYVPVFREA